MKKIPGVFQRFPSPVLEFSRLSIAYLPLNIPAKKY